MKLSHYPSKFGPGDISQVLLLDPLDLAIEESVGEEGQVGKILFQSKWSTQSIPKGAHVQPNGYGSHISLLVFWYNWNINKL